VQALSKAILDQLQKKTELSVDDLKKVCYMPYISASSGGADSVVTFFHILSNLVGIGARLLDFTNGSQHCQQHFCRQP